MFGVGDSPFAAGHPRLPTTHLPDLKQIVGGVLAMVTGRSRNVPLRDSERLLLHSDDGDSARAATGHSWIIGPSRGPALWAELPQIIKTWRRIRECIREIELGHIDLGSP